MSGAFHFPLAICSALCESLYLHLLVSALSRPGPLRFLERARVPTGLVHADDYALNNTLLHFGELAQANGCLVKHPPICQYYG